MPCFLKHMPYDTGDILATIVFKFDKLPMQNPSENPYLLDINVYMA